MIKLSKRLQCVYDLVPECGLFLDIGSDHSLLPLALLESGKALSAVAADINSEPLESGRKNAEKHGMKNISFIKSDGFENLKNLAPAVVSICGMGGEAITKIVREGKKEPVYILQPMTMQHVLREFLWKEGYMFDETYCFDKKPYVIMKAIFLGGRQEYIHSDLYIGKQRKITKDYIKYCAKIKSQTEKRLLGVPESDRTKELSLIKKCEEIIRGSR